MRILFLGGDSSTGLARWIEEQGDDVLYTEEKPDIEAFHAFVPDIIVSYKYRYILKEDVITIPRMGAVNLHISYLPYNRGAHPNVWSFLEDTPKGVSIHYIDEGIDSGDILLRREVTFDEESETLRSSYEKLNREIQGLFKENWKALREGNVQAVPQEGEGTLHYLKDSARFNPLLDDRGWDITIKELKDRYRSLNG